MVLRMDRSVAGEEGRHRTLHCGPTGSFRKKNLTDFPERVHGPVFQYTKDYPKRNCNLNKYLSYYLY